MNIETIKENIHLKSFVIGILVFTIFATLGFVYKISLLFPVSAVGLMYLGYYCKDLYWGVLLGAISTIPVIIITVCYNLLSCNSIVEYIIAIVSLLATGAVVGVLGAYMKISRKKAIAEAEKKANIGKNKNKKKNKKN